MNKLIVIFGVMWGLSLTGIPTLFAIWVWTVAIPYMEQFQ